MCIPLHIYSLCLNNCNELLDLEVCRGGQYVLNCFIIINKCISAVKCAHIYD